MSRRRKRSLDDLDELLPNELIETTKGSTVIELKAIVSQLEKQMKEMIDKYEGQIELLNERLESIENDFSQVVEALDPSLTKSKSTQTSIPGPSSTIPPSISGSQPPSGGPQPPQGGPKPPSLG